MITSQLDSSGVLLVLINRPPFNAFDTSLWQLLAHHISDASSNPDVRAVVLASSLDKGFSTGLNLSSLPEAFTSDLEPARKGIVLQNYMKQFQDAISTLENCSKPVICALHGLCLGLAIDIASAADIRVASSNAILAISEASVGLAADIGTLQRLPKKTGNDSLARELALTGRQFSPAEARELGFISKIVDGSKDDLHNACTKLAKSIAANSPVAVVHTKDILNYSADHSIEDGLQYTRAVNAAGLQTADVTRSIDALKARKTASYPSLAGREAKL